MSCTEAVKSGNQVRVNAVYENLNNLNELVVPDVSYVSIMDDDGKVLTGYPTTMVLSGNTFFHDFNTSGKKGFYTISVYSSGKFEAKETTRLMIV